MGIFSRVKTIGFVDLYLRGKDSFYVSTKMPIDVQTIVFSYLWDKTVFNLNEYNSKILQEKIREFALVLINDLAEKEKKVDLMTRLSWFSVKWKNWQ